MKKLLAAAVALAIFVCCGNSVSEKARAALKQNIEVYESAIEELRGVKTEGEMAVVVENTAHRIDELRETEEWRAYISVAESNDNKALEDIKPSQEAMRNAALEFARVLGEVAYEIAQ